MARSDPNEQAIRAIEAETSEQSRKTRYDSPSRRARSALPPDALAIIEAPTRSVTQAGAARSGQWLLRFSPRSRSFIDPLTGWTGSDDPLAHLSIRFPSREAAVGFAERQGLPYEVRECVPKRQTAAAKQAAEQQSTLQLCCWPTGPHALCCGNFPALKERGSYEQA